MHRQAQRLPRKALRYGNARRADRVAPIGALLMQGPGIVNRRRNAFGLEIRSELAAARSGRPDGVLRPDAARTLRNLRRYDRITEAAA